MPNKLTTNEFIEKAVATHGKTYGYDITKYSGNKKRLRIMCYKHGEFTQTPNHHLCGHGCPKCARARQNDNVTLSTNDFITKSKDVHGDKYDYSHVTYVNTRTKVEIVCKQHGSFFQTPNNHVSRKANCPTCTKRPYSKVSITWIESIEKKESINIQHAENGGEYTIPNTRYKVDGYCKKTNTVYEFHGDRFHGNPLVFSSDDYCHPFDNTVTARDLFEKTEKKEKLIRELGYNLITTWETV